MTKKETYYDRFILAECYYQKLKSNGADATAYKGLKNEAKDENPWAIVRLAECYIKGLRSVEDREHEILHGVEMLKPLAKQGFAFAQLKLAEHYLSVPKRKKAIKLLESCITARIPEAAELLAELYFADDERALAEEYWRFAAQWGGFSKENKNTPDEEEVHDRGYDFDGDLTSDDSKFNNIRDLMEYYGN